MSSPFEPPFEPPREREAAPDGDDGDPTGMVDGHVAVAAATLTLAGLQAFGVGWMMPAAGILGAASDPAFEGSANAPWWGAGVGGVAGFVVWAYAAACFAGVWGLRRGDRRGFPAVVVGLAALSMACPPLALHGWFAVLRDGTRQRFLDA